MADEPETTERRQLPAWFPEKSFKLERTRIEPATLRELLLKLLHLRGALRGLDLARALCLPFPLLEPELLGLKQQRLCTVVGGAGVGGYDNMDFAATDAGRERAAEIIAARPYVGPVPVALEEYAASVEAQSPGRVPVTRERLREALEGMVLADELVDRLGAALTAGGPLLLHGEPGNGKTYLAEHLARLLTESAEGIFVPHAVSVDGQVIRLLDERVHRPVEPGEVAHERLEALRARLDDRWVYVRRPFVVSGGELELPMLDLVYRDTVKVHEAPFQLKANGGLLLVDDLGRQRVEPRLLLNRWIYPLEKGVDYLTLTTGQKIAVPFRPLLVFSTNIEPAALADEAFWRRIRYKVRLSDPDAAQYRRIFEAECARAGLSFDDPSFVHLLKEHYVKRERVRRACHPRDLVGHMRDYADFGGLERKMSVALVEQACATYFVD